MATFTVTNNQDSNAGSYEIADGEAIEVQQPNPPTEFIDVEKLVNGQDADTPADALAVTVGDTINYTINVTNSSNVSIDVFTLFDNTTLVAQLNNGQIDERGFRFVGGDNDNFTLDPNETWEFTDTTPLTASTGLVTNTARVFLGPALSNLVTDESTDAANYIGSPAANPSIDFNKLVNDVEGPINLNVGDTVAYTYELTNDGNVDLNRIRLGDNNATLGDQSDDLTWTAQNPDGLTLVAGDDGDNVLEVGETWQFEADLQTAQNGTFTNRTVAIGHTPDGSRIQDVDRATYTATEPVDPTGTIIVIKDADVEDGTDFKFSGDLGNFTLDDANPDDNDNISDTQIFSNVTAGSYSITESSDPNFDLSNILINGDSDGGSVVDVANGTVDIDLDAGEDITVTFLNSKRVVNPGNTVTGTDGMDMLHGTSGRDIITGLKGMDMMMGGAGNDDFVYNDINEGFDYISDFQTGADRLILTNLIDSLGSGADPIGNGFINLLDLGGATGTLVQVDPDGSAGGAGSVNLVLLKQVSADNSNALDPDNDLVF